MKFSDRHKEKAARGMQIILVALLLSGLYTASTKVIINSSIGLLITFIPGLLEKRYDLAMNPFLSLWITSAVFFHALGSFGFYGSISWWDHLTHALSASLVAATGYTVIRAVDIHSEKIYLPKKFMFVFIILTVIAFGVIWELFEFLLDIIAANTGISMPLAQHGLDDTMKDMIYNTGGALVTATIGQAYLSEFAEKIRDKVLETDLRSR
ncbi:MAG: hypothetical protein V5A72_01430 [Candidatus Nanohaloarchaea archaeon]